MIKIGIIREEKVPQDSRVALTPNQCKLVGGYPDFEVVVQPSAIRCFTDQEYLDAGVKITDDISNCDVLVGIKEVPIDKLLEDKVYFIFSHTIKKQPHNQKLLKEIIRKRIHLIDYEVITNDNGERLIAFGHFAGMVGAHNGLWTYLERRGNNPLPRMKDMHDYSSARALYQSIKWPPVRIILTGDGRVSNGAEQVLLDMGIEKVDPNSFLEKDNTGPIFVQLTPLNYVQKLDGGTFDVEEYYKNPGIFEMNCIPFLKRADIFINGIYWDNRYPAFFALEHARDPDFKLSVIADITCDIAPESSLPTTLRASTISDPVYGFDRSLYRETRPFQEAGLDVMAIDNLPNELPRDSSTAFGEKFINFLLPEIPRRADSEMLQRATIAKNGELGRDFDYLKDYCGL